MKTIKKYCKLAFSLLFLPVFAAGFASCAEYAGGAPVIREVIHARQVPAGFDTPFICKTAKGNDGTLVYKWFSDNGTFKGNGSSVIWTSPAEPGTYRVGVKATDKSGLETEHNVSVTVVPFNKTELDINPSVSLDVPIGSNDVSGKELLLYCTSTIVEIDCKPTQPVPGKHEYVWSCNGGKIRGPAVNDKAASVIGWSSPGVNGNYTVTVITSDSLGDVHAACAYIKVTNPGCGCAVGVCEVNQ